MSSNLHKYPRTPHLPWSEGATDDDKIIETLYYFFGQRVIVTEKMDGENTSIYHDYIHARSIDGRSHPSRDWVKQFWSGFKSDIPIGFRICGENLSAKHSIHYQSLPSYFLGFSVWDNQNICLNWNDTLEWFSLLGITSVPVLYDGHFDEKIIRGLWKEQDYESKEGYVVRLASSFHYDHFGESVAKFVRKGHVQTEDHWMYSGSIERNGIL